MVNLDIVGSGRGFYAYTSSNADMNRIVNRVNATLQPVKPEVTATEPVDSDHRMFYASEIPSVLFTTGMYPQYGTVRDTPSIVHLDDMELELEYIYNFTLELARFSLRNGSMRTSSIRRRLSGTVYRGVYWWISSLTRKGR